MQEGQRVYALVFKNQDILMRPDQLPYALWCFCTCFFRVLPDIQLLGAAKSGTSSLFQYLIQHPCMHGGLSKENHFFLGRSFLRSSFEGPMLDKIVYRTFFPLIFWKWFDKIVRGRQYLVLEGLPLLRFPSVAGRVGRVNPDAKAIVVLRDPIERAYSHYRMILQHLPQWETRTFDEAMREELERERKTYKAIDDVCDRDESLRSIYDDLDVAFWYLDKRYTRAGLYSTILAPFADSFKKGNLLVLSFDALTHQPEEVCNQVFRYLGLPNMPTKLDFTPANVGTHESGREARAQLKPDTLKLVRDYYRSSNQTIKELYGIMFMD